MKSTPAKRLLLSAAIVAVVAGSMIAIVSASQPVSFAWVARAPLSGEIFDPNSAHLVSPTTVLGLVIAVVGLVAGAFWAGLTVGRRR
jgi:hypothetical protein